MIVETVGVGIASVVTMAAVGVVMMGVFIVGGLPIRGDEYSLVRLLRGNLYSPQNYKNVSQFKGKCTATMHDSSK